MTDKIAAPKRLSSLQILLGVMALSMGLGFASGLARARVSETAGDMIFAGGALVALVIGCVTMIPYWKRLDEAAREAHKDAWLWGGMVGYTVAAAYASLLVLAPGAPMLSVLGEEPRELMASGIVLTVLAQALAYGAAWGIWWMRKR